MATVLNEAFLIDAYLILPNPLSVAQYLLRTNPKIIHDCQIILA